MRTNPFSDALEFLTQGEWTSYVFCLLTIASIVIAAVNLRRDSSQRSLLHLWNWLARFFIGALWWQQSLWKLPPTYTDNPDGSGGLRYWMGEMAKWASTGLQRHFVKDVVLPHFYFFAPQVYFSEVLIAVTLIHPTPERHDRHRGKGTWVRAWRGIERARAEGFRVRLAATVSTDHEAEEFRCFLDAQRISEEDRVIRRIALRGFATEGVALARADLVPEVTITAQGVYWHPVGAEDADLLVTPDIFPLAQSFAAVRRAFERESEHRRRLATIFNCA